MQMDYSERFSLICNAIEEELLASKRKFIIYPFGANGLMTKDILNKRYGIQESMLVDNKLCHFRSDVRSASQLGDLSESDYCCLLTIENPLFYDEVVDAFKESMPHVDIRKIFLPPGGGQKEDLYHGSVHPEI